ncbi:hypothetical protein Mycch_2308 [Mycolicibacterium chubuense NBB4]|uniref:Secreted protein n=1 Tax=Mycolicibacterium chubuense (strain NBB4) TaxID=710421 RepID=I4BIH6_MYCCN|nr:hypothetical protein [Mycolicibacterium chubuense]AFM17083.1 hypothetical protein Mycch_2308 [Mycolicibacterium chubuense NBB4]
MVDTPTRARTGRLSIPRSRGAASGLLVLALGLWGALAPFIGPYFDFAFSPDQPWTWTAGRGWLEVLPGAVAALGGLLMFVSRNRATAMFGTWLAVVAGAWFVVGRALAGPLGLGDVGTPVADTEPKRVWLELTYFYGLGALIIFLAAVALGRLSVRTARDIAYVETRTHTPVGGTSPVVPESDTGSWARTTDRPDDEHVTAPVQQRRRPSLLGRFRRRREVDHTTAAV